MRGRKYFFKFRERMILNLFIFFSKKLDRKIWVMLFFKNKKKRHPNVSPQDYIFFFHLKEDYYFKFAYLCKKRERSAHCRKSYSLQTTSLIKKMLLSTFYKWKTIYREVKEIAYGHANSKQLKWTGSQCVQLTASAYILYSCSVFQDKSENLFTCYASGEVSYPLHLLIL